MQADKRCFSHNNISPHDCDNEEVWVACSCPRLFMQHLLCDSFALLRAVRSHEPGPITDAPDALQPPHLLQSNVVRTCSHNLIYLSSTGKGENRAVSRHLEPGSSMIRVRRAGCRRRNLHPAVSIKRCR